MTKIHSVDLKSFETRKLVFILRMNTNNTDVSDLQGSTGVPDLQGCQVCYTCMGARCARTAGVPGVGHISSEAQVCQISMETAVSELAQQRIEKSDYFQNVLNSLASFWLKNKNPMAKGQRVESVVGYQSQGTFYYSINHLLVIIYLELIT